MILHDFIYEWDGKTRNGEKPITWWPGSYHVRIVKLDSSSKNITHLHTRAVLLKNARIHKPMNTSLTNYIHNFAKKIAKLYDLDIGRTMWVELADHIRVATLTPDQKVVPEILYSISWREIRSNEFEILAPYIKDM